MRIAAYPPIAMLRRRFIASMKEITSAIVDPTDATVLVQRELDNCYGKASE
jgi:hypothetical protein